VVNSLYSERGEKKLVIGGGIVGVIRKIKIFSYPKIKSEAMLNVRFSSNILTLIISLENDKCRPFHN
jgi:plasmid replication initiation protein